MAEDNKPEKAWWYLFLLLAPIILWLVLGVGWVTSLSLYLVDGVTSSSLYLQVEEYLVPAPGFSLKMLCMAGVWMTVFIWPPLLYFSLVLRYGWGGSTWKDSFMVLGGGFLVMPLVGFIGVALLIANGVFRIAIFAAVIGVILYYLRRWVWDFFRK